MKRLTRRLARIWNAIVWAAAAFGVAVMTKAGRRPAAYDYAGRHAAVLKQALGDRVRSIGIARPQMPADETGIGIIRPVVDAPMEEPTAALTIDGAVVCGSTFELDQGYYECELNSGHDGDHSACGGEVTWPREAVAVVAQ